MSLCEGCSRAGKDCPIWYPGKDIDECVEYIDSEEGAYNESFD